MASQTEPAPHIESTAILSNQSSSESLWVEAINLLDPEDSKKLQLPPKEKITVLCEVLQAAEQKRKQSEERRWKYTKSDGSNVVLRDVFDKMVKWLTKLQTIGDLVVQFDPTHLTIPWAAIKFLLTIPLNDAQNLSAVFDGLEMITNLISRYIVFEELYLREVSKASELLKQAIVKLYASVLTFLAQAKRYYSQNTAKRMVKGALQITDFDVKSLTENIKNEQIATNDFARLIDAEFLRNSNTQLQNLSMEGKANRKALREALNDLHLPEMYAYLSKLSQNVEYEHKIRFLNWVSPIPYQQHHDNIRKDRIQGSGLWIFEQPKYVSWRRSASSSLLWLRGMPGSGKSKLMSLLIDMARENDKTPQAEPLAYFYCDRNGTEPERGSPLAILRSILRQLCCHGSKLEIHDVLARKHHEFQTEDPQLRNLPLVETKGLIIEFLRANPATIMIDALDECAMDLRYELLGAIRDIMASSPKKVRFLVSSRDNIGDISNRLEKTSKFTIDVNANAADIKNFVRLKVDQAIEEASLLDGQVSSSLRDTLIDKLTHGAQGMFLWAAVQMQNLCSRRIMTEADICYELQTMPKKLQDVYKQIYEQIQGLAVPSRRIATTALQWLLCAKGRLSSEDFITVVSVNESGRPIPLTTSKLLDICGNFIVLDTDLDVFRFAHLSVREFLEEKPEFAPVLTHATAAEICLNTLLTKEWLSAEITWQTATVYQYVTLYWASHIESCRKDREKGKIGNKLQSFTRDDRVTPWFAKWLLQIESASETLGWDDPLREKIENSLCNPETCFFAACAFGFLNVLDNITSRCPSVTKSVNARGATGLHLASQFGHNDLVLILLERGAEANARDKRMETALIHAGSAGHEDVVTLLLAKGADRSAQGSRFGNALQAACLHGHEDVVRLLLDGIDKDDIEAKSGQFGTALQAASLRGHEHVVNILLLGGAQVNTAGGDYTMTADLSREEPNVPSRLDEALQFLFHKQHKQDLLEKHRSEPNYDSYKFREEMAVGQLIDKEIDINVSNIGFGSALQAASRGGHETIVAALLNARADVDVEGGTYGSAIQAAAVNGNSEVISLLIDAKADISVQNGLYGTALQAACRFGHETVVQMLLEREVDVNAQGGIYGSALQAACRAGSISIIELLFNHGADVNNFGGAYFTPLQAASAKGSLQIVQLLLNQGAELNVHGGEYGSALQAASRWDHLEVVKLLMAKGGRPEASLQIATAAGHKKVVEFLLSQGVDPDARDIPAFGNALENAVAAGREDLIYMLCESGADVNASDQKFGTALQIASSLGNKRLVQLLLDRGADLRERGGNFGLNMARMLHGTIGQEEQIFRSRPLAAAAAAGHEEVVQVLLEELAKLVVNDEIRYSLEDALDGAAEIGHLSIVKLLIDSQNKLGLEHKHTPLEAACAGGHIDIVHCLIHRSTDDEVMLSSVPAARTGNAEIFKMLNPKVVPADFDDEFPDGTLLQIASYSGSADVVQLILELGAEVDQMGSWTIAPLMLACARGHDAVVRVLLEHGADPSVLQKQFLESHLYYTERNYGNPLLAAVHGGHEAIARLLLKHPKYHGNGVANSDKLIDTCAKKFGTALQVACLKGYTTIVELLLNQGAQTDICGGEYGSALQAACWAGNEGIVQILLDHGADINLNGGLYGTALQATAAGGHASLVRLMLLEGAKVKLPKHGKFGSLLQAAAANGHPEIMRCLLDHGADIRDEIEVRPTLLDRAASGGHDAVVEILLDWEANKDNNADQGRGSIFWRLAVYVYESLWGQRFSILEERSIDHAAIRSAARNGHLSIVKRLLEEGFNIADEDQTRATLLFLAAENGKHSVVRLLSQKGASVNWKNDRGRTALHMAAQNGHKLAVQTLLQERADIEARDRDKRTPLHFAAENDQYEAAYLLWINKADLNAKTSEDETP